MSKAMLAESQLCDVQKKRVRIIFPTMILSVLAVLIYSAIVGTFRDSVVAIEDASFGASIAGIAPILMVLPAFAIFLIPTVLAERQANRLSSVCPACSKDIGRSFQQVIARLLLTTSSLRPSA